MKKVKMEVMLSIFMCVLYENTTTRNGPWKREGLINVKTIKMLPQINTVIVGL